MKLTPLQAKNIAYTLKESPVIKETLKSGFITMQDIINSFSDTLSKHFPNKIETTKLADWTWNIQKEIRQAIAKALLETFEKEIQKIEINLIS